MAYCEGCGQLLELPDTVCIECWSLLCVADPLWIAAGHQDGARILRIFEALERREAIVPDFARAAVEYARLEHDAWLEARET